MTREEAKDLLLNISAYDIDMQRGMAKQEAIEMAIKALEQTELNSSYNSINSINSIKTELNELDCISRQSVLEKAYKIAGYDRNAYVVDVADIEALPSVITETTNRCGDAISRQAVNKLIDELARAISDERCFISRGRSTATIMQDILDLPSVSTEKTGRWEKLSVGYGCSECSLCTNKHGIEFYRYCPNCGAKMEVEE